MLLRFRRIRRRVCIGFARNADIAIHQLQNRARQLSRRIDCHDFSRTLRVSYPEPYGIFIGTGSAYDGIDNFVLVLSWPNFGTARNAVIGIDISVVQRVNAKQNAV